MKVGTGKLRHAFTKLENQTVTFLQKSQERSGRLRATAKVAYQPALNSKGIWSREKRIHTQSIGGEQQSYMDCLYILTSSLLNFEVTTDMRILRGKYEMNDSWDSDNEWIIITIGPCAKWGALELLAIELMKAKQGESNYI